MEGVTEGENVTTASDPVKPPVSFPARSPAGRLGEPSRLASSATPASLSAAKLTSKNDPASCPRAPAKSTPAALAPVAFSPHDMVSSPTPPRVAVYGALDLGTNNCRLLLARPSRRGFRVIDAFSRIIRLGEGMGHSGRLSEEAMERTLDALEVCAGKLDRNRVTRARLVATEACRVATNGRSFLDEVHKKLGLAIEILSPESEAQLAVSGCASLVDPSSDYVLVFDIGGGSTELVWLDLRRRPAAAAHTLNRADVQACISAWTSLPVGVVTLAEMYGGRDVTRASYEAMVADVSSRLVPFEAKYGFGERLKGALTSFLGTSGTITTIAGIELGLARYDRNRVDGCWLNPDAVGRVTRKLLASSYQERVDQPCIGRDRADLVIAGCAIVDALLRLWPCARLRVADRGLREGILTTLMWEDGMIRRRSGKE